MEDGRKDIMSNDLKTSLDRMYEVAKNVSLGDTQYSFIYCREEGKLYIYEDGVWRMVFDMEALLLITQIKSFIWTNNYTISARKQLIDNLKLLVQKPLSDFNQNGFLNFPSGLLDISGNNFLSHSKDIINTIRLPYAYDQLAECPLWLKTLLEVFEGNEEKVNILQEFFGYCLIRDTKQRKALLLLGESNCGKSTILWILRNMIGDKNCSSVSINLINNPQYTSTLMNKLCNIDTDVSSDAKSYEEQFKKITGGEPINCSPKYIPTFEFYPYCKIVLAANSFPRITDHSSAFYNRLILIPCDRIFTEEEQNKDLPELLKQELPGILQWAIKGLHRLNKRGRFEHNRFMTDAVKELREESNPIDIFFEDTIEIDLSGHAEIEKGELYKKYDEWCRSNGNHPMAANRFSQSVQQKYSKITPKNTMSHTLMKRVWKNLRYILPKQQGEPILWQDK